MSFSPLVVLEKNRVCHVCRLGSRLDERVIGAMVVYVGLEHDLTVRVSDEVPRVGRVVAVEPFRRHRILAGRQYVCTVLVEPESITGESLAQMLDRLNRSPDDAQLLADLSDLVADASRDQESLARCFSGSSFDQLVFKSELEARPLDLRIEKIAELLERQIDRQIDTGDCARAIALSPSGFRRLFHENTGLRFRYYRMWKRARTWLHHINTNAPLTQTALDLGYPDSTHFSHSIRQTYGLPPRDMKSVMQRSIFFTENYPVSSISI